MLLLSTFILNFCLLCRGCICLTVTVSKRIINNKHLRHWTSSRHQQKIQQKTTTTCLMMTTIDSWMKDWATPTRRLRKPSLETTTTTTTISSCLQRDGWGTEGRSWMTRTLWVSERRRWGLRGGNWLDTDGDELNIELSSVWATTNPDEWWKTNVFNYFLSLARSGLWVAWFSSPSWHLIAPGKLAILIVEPCKLPELTGFLINHLVFKMSECQENVPHNISETQGDNYRGLKPKDIHFTVIIKRRKAENLQKWSAGTA